ncbi:WD40 repeat domain-containing protein [Streptomyces litchfieldiae]|uniref:PQQ-binding-like beta-propeller repeat protein n=1 Tax=Streptomyces litchfieldiae TaxID=3075543 RepID=A0ABU2MMG7_9ACTN|nr:PQQ-binding-like beta-propeller repeat protein [Streptomyces sp. DSM 44938]MDT0342690.1 PQQ-binding-like beta-propeller repeat protein [Streptomyces sp. DSM 44938]
MTTLRALLESRPSRAGWQEICRRLERLDERALADIAPLVLRWPAGQRPMPDGWWRAWVAGDIRPCHALAGTRRLGRLDSVETGTVPVPVEDDRDDADSSEGAYFFGGAAAVAAPPGLRWLALAAAAEWHHNGGDIVRWATIRDAPLVWYLGGGEYYDEVADVAVNPDGRTVVTAVEGTWRAWSADTGEELWQVRPGTPGGEDEPCFGRDDLVRFGFSGDGRRLAVGTGSTDVVAVIETGTGKVLFHVPEGQDAFGPVALDATGRLLCHTGPAGRVVVRDVATGSVLATAETGLTSVGALAVAPDGAGVFAVGGAVGGVPEQAGLATVARPAARLLTLTPAAGEDDGGGERTLVPGALLRPGDFTEGLDADSPAAAVTTRAVWTADGPFAFIGADFGSLLFDGDGRTLWADPAPAVAAFTPDGSALVVVQEEIDAWFLAGLTPAPPVEKPPPPEPAPGEVILTGLPPRLLPRAGSAADDAQLPCSHWAVSVAAVSDDARALAFGAKLDRDTPDRPQVLCRWPAGPGDEPEVGVLPPVTDAAYLTDLAFGPRGDVVARALLGEEPCVVLHDVATGRTRWHHPLPPSAPHGEERLRLVFSADGSRLAVALHAAGRAIVLDTATGHTAGAVTEPATYPEDWRRLRVEAAALDATGERLAIGARDERSRVTVRDVTTGAEWLRAEPAGLRQVTALAFAPDGTALAVAGATDRGHAALWTLPLAGTDGGPEAAGPRVAVADLPMHDQPDGALVWPAKGGPRAYFPGSHGWGAVWDAASGAVLADVPFGRADGGVALSPDGETLVTVTQFGARRWPLSGR